MSKFLLVDGTALVFRGFYAIPRLSTSDGRPTNAVYGFYTILLNLLLEQKPEYLAVCFDRPEETHRKAEFAEYKAQRAKAPDELYAQISPIKTILEEGHFNLSEKAGYEADDLLATLAVKNTKLDPSMDILIYSSDLDLLQMVDGKIKVLKPGNSKEGNQLVGSEDVAKRFGFQPKYIKDYKALHGDTSDNIPGVRGIGTKTASMLIQRYGGIEEIYDHLDEITGATHTKLKEGKESAFFCKKIATLCDDVEMDWNFEKYSIHNINFNEIIKHFNDLEISKLTPKLTKLKTYLEKVKTSEKQQMLF